MEGYYSPQLDVDVRLNTNEAPEPPPAGFVAALRAEIDEVALNRYPDREATHCATRRPSCTSVDRRPHLLPRTARTRSSSPSCSPTAAPAGPRRLRADLRAALPHRRGSRAPRCSAGDRDGGLPRSTVGGDRAGDDEATRRHGEGNPAVTFLCSPNNPTGRIEPTSDRARCSTSPPVSSLSTRPTASSRAAPALELAPSTAISSSCGPSPRPGRSRPSGSGTRSPTPRSSRRSRGDPPVPSRCLEAGRREHRALLGGEMTHGSSASSPSTNASLSPSASSRSRSVPPTRTSSSSARRRVRRRRYAAGVARSVLVPTSRLAASLRLPPRDRRHTRGERRLSPGTARARLKPWRQIYFS